ncbi:hypothetical protein AVEN_43642-1 [Araneus ventricosus]|uniref:Uncharacterized protein n=1 Tax=Araneus ventricosus TaxID=182803 RepID=A0A4Y2FDF8_ARAVE|nr:hypothetical protein AVEN_43642-1 [Araneus ventricosus]
MPRYSIECRLSYCYEHGMSLPGFHTVMNMECRSPAMLVLWLGREFYRGKYGMTGNSQAWTPDLADELGDHFDDKSKIPENAIISRYPYGTEIRISPEISM